MEYANQDILEFGYNEKEETKERTSFIKRHKIMSALIASTIILIGINGFLIYEFIKILSTL